MNKVLLFTGAGMSVPMGLPAAIGFKDTIDKCEYNLRTYLEEHLNNDSNDIEKILYVLDEFVNGSIFYKFLSQKYSSNSNFAHFINFIKQIQLNAETFQQTVKVDIFKRLQKYDPKTALGIYINLLEFLKSLYKDDFSISIFTTNYDLIFEDTIDDNENDFNKLGFDTFLFGFATKNIKARNDKTEDFKWSRNIIEYNKLHGSLDWTKDVRGRVTKTGVVTVPESPQDMPLLYPGYKGTPTDEPFLSLHGRLFQRLSECDEAFVVGFAFRDPYINSIFEFALRSNPNLKVKCFNPLSVDKLPQESAIPQFVKSAPKQFIYLENGIENKKNPLSLPPF